MRASLKSGTHDRVELEQRLGWGGPPLDEALERLTSSGRIEVADEPSGARYSSPRMIIPFGAPAGWEAAVFDHFQTMVTAIVTKVCLGARRAAPDDRVGGSTYHFELWRGHPLDPEVLGLLASFRRQASLLRSRVVEYNHAHPEEAAARIEEALSVDAYMGQHVRSAEDKEDAVWQKDD